MRWAWITLSVAVGLAAGLLRDAADSTLVRGGLAGVAIVAVAFAATLLLRIVADDGRPKR